MTTFADIAAHIIQAKQTGMLSVIVKNGEHHVKIFFAQGEIYYLSYGDLKDADCLAACETLQLGKCIFTAGAKMTANAKCSTPTSAIVERLKKRADTGGGQPAPERAESTYIFSLLEDELRVAFTRQVGPVGDIVFSTVLKQWRHASRPTRRQLIELAGLLGDAIDDERSRKEFMREAGAIIS